MSDVEEPCEDVEVSGDIDETNETELSAEEVIEPKDPLVEEGQSFHEYVKEKLQKLIDDLESALTSVCQKNKEHIKIRGGFSGR
ncbi:Hypothetical predicted protein [Cloeon dipterum]|uniref:Uncharacterized protein n=1 Tax=Cloeon dipterum TaxID=197152 RepID=A0A8S1DEZ7_9INSE|nr:Hypothetical predicted protein [Cloeon dipterum]